MIDDISEGVEDIIENEIVTPALFMKGFVRIKAIDFDTLNNEWTVKANEMGMGVDSYTYCLPDADGIHAYARIEDEGMTDFPVISKEEAITQGMRDE